MLRGAHRSLSVSNPATTATWNLRSPRLPVEIACRYEVLNGGSSVHAELLTESEFRAFMLNRAHDAVALSPNAASGTFRRIIEQPGKYELVISNARQAPPVMVSLVAAQT